MWMCQGYWTLEFWRANRVVTNYALIHSTAVAIVLASSQRWPCKRCLAALLRLDDPQISCYPFQEPQLCTRRSPVDAYLIDSLLCAFAEGSSSHPTTSATSHVWKIPSVDASEIKLSWRFYIQKFRKVLVCRRDVFFRLKFLSFGRQCDEVAQMKSRGVRKAISCKTLTYSERAESPLSPKLRLSTICDLCLLLRIPDRAGYFPSLRWSWCQFCCYFNIGTN